LPPDTNAAVDHNYVAETVNFQFRVFVEVNTFDAQTDMHERIRGCEAGRR
jgi:hypothetical protein